MKKIYLAVIFLWSWVIFAGQVQAETKLNLVELEKKYNAVIGFYAIDTESGKKFSYRANERFSYCSTHKVFAVGELLRQKNISDLDKVVKYSEADVLSYAPITKEHVAEGMTLAEICSASIRWSDNTAANLILKEIGGVESFAAALRKIGDKVTKPARYEPELNLFDAEKNRDTSTPKQMTKNLQAYVLGDVLSYDKKILLKDWMLGNAVTDTLIKAGTPTGWKVFDKSGSGDFGARNDIAAVYPPDRKPIVMAIMSRRKESNAKFDDALIAETAKLFFDSLGN